MSPLTPPPQQLAGFPFYELEPSRRLYRIHRAVNGPWWFSAGGAGRFDLAPPKGSCYLAESRLGAFVEVFRGLNPIPEAEIDARRISTLSVLERIRLADCTSPQAYAFGITGEIHSSPDYTLTHAWAAAFAHNGFAGVRYLVRHDPARALVGIALFGSQGAKTWPVAATRKLDRGLLRAANQRFGIRVLPTP